MGKLMHFRFRAFISVLTGFSFLAVVLSGIALFVSPQGRIANWSNWTFWGLSKNQWSDLHIWTSVLLMAASVFHLWLNGKAFLSYFVGKAKTARFRTEWIAALVVFGVFWWGSLHPHGPFRSLLNLSEQYKHTQPVESTAPPVPHAELLTVEEVAAQAEMPLETLLENLRNGGIEAAPSDVFGEIAEGAGLSPEALYQQATGQKRPDSREGSHSGQRRRGGQSAGGFGQLTLSQLSDDLGISAREAVELLEAAGIEASPDQTIRSIADENQIHPSEIRHYLETP